MIICQSIRSVLDHRHTFAANRSRPLATITVVLLTIVLSLSMVAPTMARGGDNDDDGLANGDENKYGTDRSNRDTDGDGLFDGAEVFTHRTSPTDNDTDRDGVWDGIEVNLLLNPTYYDSDSDELGDGAEMAMGTSPWLYDTDSDDLSDSWEIKYSYTSPIRADTDSDGYSDSQDHYPLDSSRWFVIG